MTLARIFAVAGLLSAFASIALAEPTARSPQREASLAPRRLQLSAQSRPLTHASLRKTEAQRAETDAPPTTPTVNVAQTSFRQSSVLPSEGAFAAGERLFEPALGVSGSEWGGDCTNVCCNETPVCWPNWYAGFEATFLMPHFSNNIGYTLMESDGTSFESFSDVEFDYDLAFSPRVFAGVRLDPQIGFQVTWWRFDHDPDTLSVQPPANGFGRISPPAFGDVDISTTIPGDSFAAASGLSAYTIDIEMTKQSRLACWTIGVAGGVRYAELEQSYRAETTDTTGVLSGAIDFDRSISAFGPTISMYGSVPVANRMAFFARGRGSLLFGEATNRLEAGEDLDLITPFTTSRTTRQDDLLAIGEVQLGLNWQGYRMCRIWQPFASVALEGQYWNGAGSPTSEDGDLGFFGFTAAAGMNW